MPAAGERARARAERAAERTVGQRGRLITWSKSSYHRALPHHLAVFNAELRLLRDDDGFWQGDLDLTLDEPRLRELAARLRRPFRVGPERPVAGEWIAVFRPNGRLELNSSWGVRSRAGLVVREGPRVPVWAR